MHLTRRICEISFRIFWAWSKTRKSRKPQKVIFRCFLFRVFVYDIGYIRKLGRWKLRKCFPRFPRNPSFRIATFDRTSRRVGEWVSETDGKRECPSVTEGASQWASERVKSVSYVSLINLLCSLFLVSSGFFLNKYGFSHQTGYLEIRTQQISVRVSNLLYRAFINSEIILTVFFPYESVEKVCKLLPQR